MNALGELTRHASRLTAAQRKLAKSEAAAFDAFRQILEHGSSVHGTYEAAFNARARAELESAATKDELNAVLVAQLVLSLDEHVEAALAAARQVAVAVDTLTDAAQPKFGSSDAAVILRRLVDLALLGSSWRAVVADAETFAESLGAS